MTPKNRATAMVARHFIGSSFVGTPADSRQNFLRISLQQCHPSSENCKQNPADHGGGNDNADADDDGGGDSAKVLGHGPVPPGDFLFLVDGRGEPVEELGITIVAPISEPPQSQPKRP